MNKEKHFVICACGHMDHMFVLTFYEDDDLPELILSVHLYPHRQWYRRIWRAITYIFGTRPKYGDFDDVILDRKKAFKLADFLEDSLIVWPEPDE